MTKTAFLSKAQFLVKAYKHCLELGITKEEINKVITSSVVFSIVPSLSIVVGLFVLISVMGTVWAWWRLSVIGSLSYESMSVNKTETSNDWKYVLSGVFMLCMFSIYIPVLQVKKL